MEFEWDVQKAEANFKKQGVMFSEARPVLEDDDHAITVCDDEPDPSEERFVTIGMGVRLRLLVVVYCFRESNIRIISARTANAYEQHQYEEFR